MTRWSKWCDVQIGEKVPVDNFPDGFGIYQVRAVLRSNLEKPLEIGRLGGIDRSGLLYIGRSGIQSKSPTRTIKNRVNEFLSERKRHSGGETYKSALSSLRKNHAFINHQLQVRGMQLPEEEIKSAESDALKAYVRTFAELPPCNSRWEIEHDPKDCEKELIANLKAYWRKHGKSILNDGLVPGSTKATGVDGNTYRAYSTFYEKPKQKPSKIFSDWIDENRSLRALSAQTIGDGYKRFHGRLLRSLCKYWNEVTGEKPNKLNNFPHAAKLVDLHIKHIVWHRLGSVNARQRDMLMRIAYQPLDLYSLAKLLPCLIPFTHH